MKIFGFLLVISLYIPALHGQGTGVVDSLERELKVVRNDSMKFEVLNKLARVTSDSRQKLKFAERAALLATELEYPRGIGQSYMKMAQAHRKLGDLPDAISTIFKALRVYEKDDYKQGIAVAYNTLGTIYASQEDYPKSILNLNKALSISLQILDSTNSLDLKKLAGNYNNLGEVYRLSKVYDSANFNFWKAHDLYKDLGISNGEAYALGNIGLVYASQGKYVLAEENMKQASDILEEQGDRYPIAVYNTHIANIYQERGELTKALGYATQSYHIAREERLKAQMRDASMKISELYEDLKDYEKAYFYQSKYIAYRDSINNDETIRKMADLQTEYEVSKKQIEVDLLNQEGATQRFILFSLAIISALMIALIYVLYTAYNMKMKSHRVLAAQKSAIKTQRDELTTLNETKDRFFSIISHDLRGPVSSFQGVAELIRILVDNNETNELLRVSDELDKSTGQLAALLDNLLYWALSQQGRFPHSPEKVSLEEMTQTTFNVLENMASSKNIKMESEIHGDLHLWADRNSVLTILRNILNNALKFTPSGSSVRLEARAEEASVKILIVDEGVGIPQNKLKSLFGFEGKRSTWGTAGEKGVGLGLTLTQEFVEINGGTINVESEEGKGTTFIVQLPIYKEVLPSQGDN